MKRIPILIREYRVLIENFSFLGILQISQLLIAMALVPYLYRVLGTENYGLVVFAQTLVAYLTIFTNFGFNVTATRDISSNRQDHVKVCEISSRVLSTKAILFVFTVGLMLILSLFIDFLQSNMLLFAFSLIFCLAETIFPIWYFQGIEKMKYITYINVSSRVASALIIFIVVKDSSQYRLVPLFLGSGALIGAIWGLVILLKNKVKISGLSILNSVSGLRENLPLFISNISSQIYVTGNKILIGSILGMSMVAQYDVADKVVTILKLPIQILSQTLFPKVANDRNSKFLLRLKGWFLAVLSVIYILLYISSDHIVFLLTGDYDRPTANLLRILAISIIPIGAGMFYSELLLVSFGYLKEYSRMRVASLLVYSVLVSVAIVSNRDSLILFGVVILIVEIFVMLYSRWQCINKGIV